MNRLARFSAVVAALLVAAFFALPAIATRFSPQTNPSIVTSETFSAIAATDGFCVGATTTPTNAWLSAPARITAVQGAVRFITVCHADDTDSTIDVCARLNGSSGMTCGALDTGTTGRIGGVDQCVSWVLARDNAFAAPSVFLASASGTVTTCIDVGY